MKSKRNVRRLTLQFDHYNVYIDFPKKEVSYGTVWEMTTSANGKCLLFDFVNKLVLFLNNHGLLDYEGKKGGGK